MNRLDAFLGRLFAWCARNPVPVLAFFFVLSLCMRYVLAFSAWRFLGFPFQRYDPYLYTVKGLEIAAGDWSPLAAHGIGWPAVLGGVFSLWRGSSIFENMAIASFVAVFFSAAALFPLMAIARRAGADAYALLMLAALFASSFFLALPENDSIAMADPLFIFLFLSALAFLYMARVRPALLAAAGVVASAAYWTKPVGIFIVPVIALSYWFWERDRRKAVVGIALFAFFFVAASAPFLAARHAAFGSFFDYAENSKYFADTYTDAWGEAVPRVPFTEYVATHGIPAVTDKFLIGGLLFVIGMLLATVLPYFFGWLRFVAHEDGFADDRLYPLWIACAVWIAGLVPVFHIYSNPRHVIILTPVCLVVGALGFERLARGMRLQNVARAGMAVAASVFLVASFSMLVFFSKDKKIAMRDGAVWARELAPLLSGNVAMGNGSDILMMQYPDARAGGGGMLSMRAPLSGVAVRYPGKFGSMEALRPWLRAADIGYVVLDDAVKESFSFAPDKYLSIYTGVDFPPYLRQIYSNYESNSQWKVRVFVVDKKLLWQKK